MEIQSGRDESYERRWQAESVTHPIFRAMRGSTQDDLEGIWSVTERPYFDEPVIDLYGMAEATVKGVRRFAPWIAPTLAVLGLLTGHRRTAIVAGIVTGVEIYQAMDNAGVVTDEK